MALVFTPNTYAGELASGYISRALLESDTIDRGLITLLTNVKKRQIMRLIDMDAIIQTEKCNFNPLGDTRLSERYLDPVTFEINTEICKPELRQSWEAAALRPGRLNEEIPTDLADFMRDEMIRKIGIALDKLYWTGKSAGTTTINGNNQVLFESGLVYQGILPMLAADPSVIDVDVEPFTPANVIPQLSAIYTAIPEEIRGADGFKMPVASNVATSYTLAQANVATGQGAYFVGSKSLNFLGTEMEIVKNLPPNTVLAYRVANMMGATDLQSDLNTIQMLDLSNTTGDQKVRFIAKWAFAGNYAYGDEIVYARPIA